MVWTGFRYTVSSLKWARGSGVYRQRPGDLVHVAYGLGKICPSACPTCTSTVPFIKWQVSLYRADTSSEAGVTLVDLIKINAHVAYALLLGDFLWTLSQNLCQPGRFQGNQLLSWCSMRVFQGLGVFRDSKRFLEGWIIPSGRVHENTLLRHVCDMLCDGLKVLIFGARDRDF